MATNTKGLGHLAFRVDDVQDVLERLIVNGGNQLGDLVQAEIYGAGTIEFIYARDPDGNIIELQKWK